MLQEWIWPAIVGLLGWVFLDQRQTIRNHLANIQIAIDSLPCRDAEKCPLEDEP
jgi:hypothetical protein